jgi:hypothetical protein
LKSTRFAVAVVVVGLGVALGAFAYLLDHARASAHVLRGLGDAAESGREAAFEVLEPTAEEGADAGVDATESVRRSPLLADPPPSAGLEIHVVDEAGESPTFAEVLAYRGDELVRAGRTDGEGLAHLIPFDGPVSLRVEYGGHELARLDVEDGRGRHEIVVTRAASVAGIVRVDGLPRWGVGLSLIEGDVEGDDEWIPRWIRRTLARNGLRALPSSDSEISRKGGSFRFDWLPPQWSGVLRVQGPDVYRFANGERYVALAQPQEELVLDLETIHPELEIRGRVIVDGEPWPDAFIEAHWKSASGWDSGLGATDELGRFRIRTSAEPEMLHLEFSNTDIGPRTLELRGPLGADLGDLELRPVRDVPFVVRSESGAPIAGARAQLRTASEPRWDDPFRGLRLWSEPTGPDGRGALRWLESGEAALQISARGYATSDVSAPADAVGPLPVVLARSASAHVVVRDGNGRVPRGLHLWLVARVPPFTWANGFGPRWDEVTPDVLMSGAWCEKQDDKGIYSSVYGLDRSGQAWIDALRPGASFDLRVVDGYGTVVAAARGLALEEGEWRRVDLRVEVEPRTLLVVVRDTFGHPLNEASVQIGETDERQALSTDRAGMTRTEPLYADHVSVRVHLDGFESRTVEHVAVPPEGATLELRLAHEWWSW